MFTVRVDEPDVRFGNMLLEQFGGANGEFGRSDAVLNPGVELRRSGSKGSLMDIGTEELSHLEIVGCLARMHLKPSKFDRQAAEADPLIAIAGGGGVNLFNSQGNPWTADYLKITGELDVDLRSNIAAEARAKIVYERLINFCDNSGTKDALQFLMTRRNHPYEGLCGRAGKYEEATFQHRQTSTTPGLVNQFFNNSTGAGDEGEIDTRGPWNQGADLGNSSNSPALSQPDAAVNGSQPIKTESSPPLHRRVSAELLVDELRDILHAEKQLTKALPKMAKAARFHRLGGFVRAALSMETEQQIDRLNECLSLLERNTPCGALQGY